MTADFTMGVEEEYQLVDPRTGELRSRAPQVLADDWAGVLQAEMMQTMIEVGTPVCGCIAELEAQIGLLRTQAAIAAAASGLEIVAAAMHPDDDFENQRRSEGARYTRIAGRLGRIGRTDHIFGMHVHVAIPAGVDRAALIGRVREYLPHLIGLSASSPLYAGTDTGFASYRTVMAGRLPNSGMPPALASEEEYRRFMEVALRAGVLPDEASLYWSLRPHSRYPTVEFRASDVCPRLEDAVAIAGLVRAVVVAAVEGMPGGFEGIAPGSVDSLLRANEWQAARFGLDARVVRSGSGVPMQDDIRRLLEAVEPLAASLGDDRMADGIERILRRGNGADRIRRRSAGGEDIPGLMRWLAGETLLGTGMDRRAEQRMPEPASA